MSVRKVKTNSIHKISGLESKWDEAIADAQNKIRRLRETIRVYKTRKKSGDPWPGSVEGNDLATHI